MRKIKFMRIAIALFLTFAFANLSFNVSASSPAATSPGLGAAASYSVLAGSIVTNTGGSTISGDLGISPSIGVPPHFTGFPPGVVGPPGTIHDADADAAAAQASNTAAFGALDQSCDVTYPGVQDLSLVSPLGEGVYCADAFLITGNLTLSGAGVWIFKSASTLTTSSGASVTGGDACNVWWRLVSSGTIGTGSSIKGNILALTDISLQTGASLNGRALVQTGQVTLDNNAIFGPNCESPPTNTPTATTPVNTPTNTPTITPTNNGTVVPTNTPTITPTSNGTIVATNTPTSTETNSPTKTPPVPGLPPAGGAPIRSEESPWSLVIVGGIGALALILGVRAYRRTKGLEQ